MKTVKLCDICDVRDGTHDSPSYYLDGYPFITTKNLVNGTIDFSTASLICEEDFRHFDKRSHVDDGDILMPMIGTIGGAVIVNKDREFAIKNVALIKKDKESIDFNFLLHVLNSNKMLTYFEQFKTGGTQKFISLNFIRNLPIPEKSLPEQQKIAAHLDSIQSAIDNKKQQLQQLDELVKSKFVEMFGNPGINENNYGIVSITELSQNLDSRRKPVTAKNRTEGEFPYYGASGIVDYVGDYLFDEDILLISEDGANLIARSTPIAFSVKGKVWVNNHAHVLSFTNRETQIFVEFYFSLFDISPFVTGAAQPKLSQNKLNEIPIFNPPIELQNDFATFVQKIDTAKSIIKTQLADLQELLDSKMDEYFGE